MEISIGIKMVSDTVLVDLQLNTQMEVNVGIKMVLSANHIHVQEK